MWRLKQPKTVEPRLVTIAANYEVLLEHDEPVLFTGTTELGTRVIGSSVDEDENGGEQFFHSLVADNTYSDLINRKISYLKALENATALFVVDRHGDSTTAYSIAFSEVPTRYRPLPESFLPEFELVPSSEYSISLKGLLADTNSAEPSAVVNIQTKGAALIQDAFASIGDLMRAHILLRPATAGSFRINYRVVLDREGSQEHLFRHDLEKDYLAYANAYLRYCLNDLPAEAEQWAVSSDEGPPLTQPLFQQLVDLRAPKDEDSSVRLRRTFAKSVQSTLKHIIELSGAIGEGYQYIEVSQESDTHALRPLGVVDSDYRTQIERTSALFEKRFESIEIDTDPQEYKILIYHLNTDSRLGNALIYNVNSQDELSKPRIKISGEQPITNSKYTESMHKNRFIPIRGIATRQGKKFREIDIVYE